MKDLDNRTRWLAFVVLCLGDLMTVLDSSVVNLALPSIREGLHFSPANLVWVVNAFLLTFMIGAGFAVLAAAIGWFGIVNKPMREGVGH